jgi:hypothetical protein
MQPLSNRMLMFELYEESIRLTIELKRKITQQKRKN